MRTITKRLLSLVLTLAMLLSLGLTVQAVNTAVTVTLNGTALEAGSARLYRRAGPDPGPREHRPPAGADLSAEGREVTFVKGEASLTFRDGSKEAGGMTMDTAADLSGEVGYVPLAYLAQFFGLSLTWNGAARTAALSTGSDLTVADIQSIQAYTDETMYGTGVVEVQVTYKPGVNVSGVTADSYILEDRGSCPPTTVGSRSLVSLSRARL